MVDYEPEPYRPVNRRRRVLIAVLAVVTAVVAVLVMTRKSGMVRHAAQHPADVAACTNGQTSGCVGSMTSVIVAPASAASQPAR